MAGRRVYGGSNMVVILPNEVIAPDSIESLLASGNPGGFHGSRSTVNFEDVPGSTPERALYHHPIELEETGIDDSDDCFHHPEKKRRLTSNQVQFLEKSFEMENKLEPERKLQLAKDLGLQPRQVAIWFQNRRARWKTKQLEKDYEVLRSSYNNLKADYENLLREKEKLKAEVIVLTEKLFLEEKGRSSSETLELEGPLLHHQVQRPGPVRTSEVAKPDAPNLPCKQEEISSANSTELDSDSPRCSDGGHSPIFEPADSSKSLEHDYSDLSHAEDEEEMHHFPKLDDSSCHYGFQVEDQAFWFWPSCQ